MGSIKNLLFTIAKIGIVSGIFDMLSTTTKYRKYVKYAASLLVVLLLLSPFSKLIELISSPEIRHKPEYYSYNTDTQDHIKEAIETAIRNDITTKYSMPNDSIKVIISIKESLIECVEIIIKNETYFRYAERIKAYSESNYGCEIKVIQEFETS